MKIQTNGYNYLLFDYRPRRFPVRLQRTACQRTCKGSTQLFFFFQYYDKTRIPYIFAMKQSLTTTENEKPDTFGFGVIRTSLVQSHKSHCPTCLPIGKPERKQNKQEAPADRYEIRRSSKTWRTEILGSHNVHARLDNSCETRCANSSSSSTLY